MKILRLAWILVKMRASLGQSFAAIRGSQEAYETLGSSPRETLSKAFAKLGPIYIKLGQTLSTRPDFVGEVAAEDLKNLQDKIPPFSAKQAIKRFESECGIKISDVFEQFDATPVAAASIAQVHKARLKSGEWVAVKILRPNIEKEYAADIKGLRFCAKLVQWFLPKYKRLKAMEVVDLFAATMRVELNLKMEAACASELRDNTISDVYVPKVYWEYTAQRVLTTEWIDGVSIYDSKQIAKMKLDPKELSAKIAHMFWDQAYNHGFFHADLHPGNILVRKDGSIALLDFGIMGRLPEADRLFVAEILGAFLMRDYLRVSHIHIKAGYVPAKTDAFAFAQNCRIIAEPIMGLNLSDISIAKLLSELFRVTEEFGMETQPQLLMLQKTMVVVEGIGKSLNPDINMWKLAEPWMKRWAAKNISPEARLIRSAKKFLKNLDFSGIHSG